MPGAKRSRSFKRTRSVGRKRRGSFKVRRGKSLGAGRRRFKGKRGRSTKKGSKQQLVMLSDIGDRSLLYTWIDEPKFVNTTGAQAFQCVWSQNTVASANVAVNLYGNLLCDDSLHLQNMFRDLYIVLGSAGGLGNKFNNLRLIRKSCTVSARIVNAETSTVQLWEYRVVARRDIIESCQDTLNLTADLESGLGGGTSGSPTTAVPTVGTVVGGLFPMTLGSTPFMFHGFTSQFRVAKVRKWELKPGQVKKLTYSLKKPKRYSYQNLLSAPGTITDTGGTGITYFMRKGQAISLFVAKGTFATLSTGGATFTRGISNVNLGIEYCARYHYAAAMCNPSASGATGSVAGFSANVAQAPLAMVINHPDSAITTIGTTNGIGSSGNFGATSRVYSAAGIAYVPGAAGVGDGIITDV